MSATDDRRKAQEWLIGMFSTAKEKKVIISKDLLIGEFCLKFYKNRRYCLDMMRIFEMLGKIRMDENEVFVL